jgi:pseudaminic acid synthase
MKINKNFKINGKLIGENTQTYIIAEMSANHGGDFSKAVDLIHAAKESGADAIKLQTYKANTLTLDCKEPPFYIKTGPWKGQYLYDLYKGAFMPWDWHAKLQEIANKIGITIFSSPFDFTAVDLLEELNMPAYKIASPEVIDLALIRRVAQTGKPLIISTGNATIGQIHEAIEAATKEGATDVSLLKCTSTYPAPPEEINLKTIPNMYEIFKCPIGLSDHTLGIGVPIASVAFGTSIIEKHFILDKNDDSVDNFFSLTPNEFKSMVDGIRIAQQAIGEVKYPIQTPASQRSLIVVKDIQKGEILNNENIKSLRPGGGLEPKYFEKILNRKTQKKLKKGSLLSWDMIGGY